MTKGRAIAAGQQLPDSEQFDHRACRNLVCAILYRAVVELSGANEEHRTCARLWLSGNSSQWCFDALNLDKSTVLEALELS